MVAASQAKSISWQVKLAVVLLLLWTLFLAWMAYGA